MPNDFQPISQAALLARFPFLRPRAGNVDGMVAVDSPPENLRELATALRDEFGFSSLTDLAGCDWGVEARPRFGVVCHFARVTPCEYLRVGVEAAESDTGPVVPSLAGIFPSANWFEREAYDMFGIWFADHPDMRRILMWDEFQWHPLRKDFPLGGLSTDVPVVAWGGACVRAVDVSGAGSVPRLRVCLRWC